MKFLLFLMMLEVFTFIKAEACSPPAEGCGEGFEWDSVNCQCIQLPVCSIAFGCADAPSYPPCTCLRCIDEPCDDGSPRLLEYDCQCPQIVCDPAYGCGNWLGYPDCQCTACIEDLCIDGSSRSLDNFCQCPPCPKPANCSGDWDDFNCKCLACDPILPKPSTANQWLPYPDCKWTCVPETCSGTKVWDSKRCKCRSQSV